MFVAGSCAGSCQKANAALYNRCEKGRAMTLKSLRLKITWLLLVATLIPLITATIYSHYIASLTIYEKISLTTMSTLKTVSQGVDSELMRLTAEMESATSSREFQKTVNEIRLAQTDGEKWVALRKMDKLMIGIFGKTYAVNGVYLTLPNGESYAVQDKYRLNLKELSKQPWFQDTDSNFGALASCGLVELQEGKSALMFGKPLRDVVDVGNLSVIGSIHFAIDPVLLSALSVKDEDGSSSFLLNSSGQVVAQSVSRATDPEGAVRLIEENWGMLEQDDSGSATVTLGTQQMMLLFDTSPMYRYHYVRLIPLSLYTSELSGISSATFLFALVCVVAVVLVSVAVSNHISKPVNELNRAMRYTEKGNFDIQLQSHRKDEIGQIIQCFNKMVRRLHSFFDQTIADEKEKKRLEIESLQYQISPHFLYNQAGFRVTLRNVCKIFTPRNARLRFRFKIQLSRMHQNRHIKLDAFFNNGKLHRVVHPILVIHFYADKAIRFAALNFLQRGFGKAGVDKTHSSQALGTSLNGAQHDIIGRAEPYTVVPLFSCNQFLCKLRFE